MSVGKEIEMRIERIAIFPFPRHDYDESTSGDAAQLGDSLAVVENVLDDMRADDRIDFAIGKGQRFDFGGNILDAFQPRCVIDHEIDARQPRKVWVRPANMAQ